MEKKTEEGPSQFVRLRDIPPAWDERMIEQKCSPYGFVNEVIIYQDLQMAIVEFDNESDAADFVADSKEEFIATLHYPSEESEDVHHAMDSLPMKSSDGCGDHEEPLKLNMNTSNDYAIGDLEINDSIIDTTVDGPVKCGNSSCSNFLVKAYGEVFCNQKCFEDSSLPEEMFDMYDKWLSALGRGGSGLLTDRKNIDNLVISVNKNGIRSITISPPKGRPLKVEEKQKNLI